MYFGFGAPLNGFGFSRPQAGGAGRATLRDGGLLNRFFPFQCILTKERNALRLDDALLSGSWWGKNRFLTQDANAPLLPAHPLRAANLVSTSPQAGACISPAGAERLPAGLWPKDTLLSTAMSERRGRRRNILRAFYRLGHIQRQRRSRNTCPRAMLLDVR